MKKLLLFILVSVSFSLSALAADGEAPFNDSEKTFKLVMQKLLEKYSGKDISKDDLYRAATAGMLRSLNADPENKERAWNTLLTPEDVKEMQIDLTGKVAGIGAAIAFDKEHGYGNIIHVIAGSPAEKYGLKTGDQILNVNGEKFKDKTLRDMVMLIRGEPGKKVNLKVLRGDQIVDLAITRAVTPWTRVALQEIDPATALLYIDYFSAETAKQVEKYLNEVNSKHYTKLIVDVRNNNGGGFDEATKTASYFLPKGAVVASTKDRHGEKKEVHSTGAVLNSNVELVVLTNEATHCGAELLTAALKENRHARTVGQKTSGKWNVQSVEMLPNSYAMKYTVSEFFSPEGRTYQDKGIKPDVEVAFVSANAKEDKDTSASLSEMREKYTLEKWLATDAQLKAAVELVR